VDAPPLLVQQKMFPSKVPGPLLFGFAASEMSTSWEPLAFQLQPDTLSQEPIVAGLQFSPSIHPAGHPVLNFA
jgi:hypothetical protein